MNVIRPLTNIDRGDGVVGNTIPQLISTNVTNINADWDNLTPYVVGEKAVVDFLLYQCTVANTGENPTDPASTFWVNIGYANIYQMFNGNSTSYSVYSGVGDMEIVISGEDVDSIGLFGMTANTVTITQDNGGDETYNNTIDTGFASEGVTDFWTWLFAPFPDSTSTRDIVITDIPNYGNSEITIKLAGEGDKSLGMLVAGQVRSLGMANFGTSVSDVDYSTKEPDGFGGYKIVERLFVKTVDYDVTMLTPNVAQAQQLLSAYRTTPVAWIGDNGYESTIVFGFRQDFDIVLSNYTLSQCSINVTGI